MIDLDRAVLYLGIASVLAVATFNHLHASGTQPSPFPVELSSGSNKVAVRQGPVRAVDTMSSPLR